MKVFSLGTFKELILRIAEDKKTRLVLALDVSVSLDRTNRDKWNRLKQDLLSRALKILEATSDFLVAVKVNRHLVLPLGLYDLLPILIDEAKEDGLLLIMDAKLNDIGYSNWWIAHHYFNAGFDAIIANPFVGWKGGLDVVFEEAKKRKKGVLLLCYMSHPGAREGYGQYVIIDKNDQRVTRQYIIFAKRALEWSADGVIVGATAPEIISEVKSIVSNECLIFSPGIGAQGGDPRTALGAGADFLIVGRRIYMAQDPRKEAKRLYMEIAALC